MKRAKRLTKKERKAIAGPRPAGEAPQRHAHIHCTACGRHLDEEDFDEPAKTATWLTCDHRSQFASCVACADKTRELLAEHDRTGQPVRQASAWH